MKISFINQEYYNKNDKNLSSPCKFMLKYIKGMTVNTMLYLHHSYMSKYKYVRGCS